MRNGWKMSNSEEKIKGIKMKDFKKYLEENKSEFIEEEHAFADYMRALFKEKGMTQQEIFLQADIPE